MTMLLASFCAMHAQETSGIEAAALPFTRNAAGINAFSMGGVNAFDDLTYFALGGSSLESELSFRLFKAPVQTNDLGITTKLKASDRLAFAINAAYDIGPELGGFKTSDMLVGLGASFNVNDMLSVGVTGRYASSSLAKDCSLSGFGADVLATSLLGPVKITAGVRNLGTKVNGAPMPASISAGAVYELEMAEDSQMTLACDMDYFFINSLSVSAGAAYTWKDMLSAKLGYHMGGVVADYLSLGLGGRFKGISVDAAYVLYSPSIGGTMMFGLGYKF